MNTGKFLFLTPSIILKFKLGLHYKAAACVPLAKVRYFCHWLLGQPSAGDVGLDWSFYLLINRVEFYFSLASLKVYQWLLFKLTPAFSSLDTSYN